MLLALAACEVANPAYDPSVRNETDGGANNFDGGSEDRDGGANVTLDGPDFLALDGPTLALDAPVDAVGAKVDVAPLPDAAIVKLDVAPPPPDAATVKLDVAPPPPDAAVTDLSLQKQSCAPDPSLVLCVAFEDKVVDQSTLASSFNTSSLAFEAGPMGKALLSSASTRIVNNALTTAAVPSVTIEAWINPARLPSTGRRFGIIDYQPQYSLFILPGGELSCGCDGFHQITTQALIKVAAWQSVACTIDDQAIKIWVNGFVRAEKSNDGLCPTAVDSSGMAVLGNITSGGSPYPDSFEGRADNVRVWSRVRTDVEICADALLCAP